VKTDEKRNVLHLAAGAVMMELERRCRKNNKKRNKGEIFGKGK
jgi:hypothetical protein